MADIIFPDSRLEAPELFYPGRKPVGNVKIDWSNPLARGVKQCLLFDANSSKPVDLAGYRDYSYVNGHIIESTAYGLGYTNSTSTSYVKADDDLGILSQGSSSPFTMFAKFLFNGNKTNHQSLMNVRASGTATITIRINSDSAGTPNVLNAYCVLAGATRWSLGALTLYPNDGFPTCFSVSHEGSNNPLVVKDGASYSGSNLSTNTTPISDAWATVGEGTADIFRSYYYISILYDRALSAEEHKSLHSNPYQFLIPA